MGQDLVLTGGRPRGTLYAVYEFLERQVGCHWLDRETEIVPSRPTLTVDALDVRAKPWFWIRHVSSPTGSPADHWLFLVRNKNCRYDQPDDFAKLKGDFPAGAFYRLEGSPRVGHSFSYFVNAKDWYADASRVLLARRRGQAAAGVRRGGAGPVVPDAPGRAAADRGEAAGLRGQGPRGGGGQGMSRRRGST